MCRLAQDCTGEEYIELRNTLKKTSTENLIKKLNKAGFTLDDLKPIISDRSRLIDECLVLNKFGKSSLRMASPVTAEGGGGGFAVPFKIHDAGICQTRRAS